MGKALVLDDSPVLAGQLCNLLAAQGVKSAWLQPGAFSLPLPADIELVFVALQLRADNGFRLLRQLAVHSSCQLVGISDSGRQSDFCWAALAGAVIVLDRPLQRDKLAACLRTLVPVAAGNAE